MLTNANQYLTDYINTESETVLRSSYDIYVPEASKSSRRAYSFGLTADKDTDAKEIVSTSTIRNGTITFSCSESSIECSERKITAGFETDQWHTVEHIVKITPSADGYDIKVYGILDDVCYYENEYTSSTNVFHLAKNDMQIRGTGNSLTNIVTGYDNINLSSITNYADTFTSGFGENYVYPLVIKYDTDSITAIGRVADTTEKHCLILAVFDDENRFVKLKPITTVDSDGYMSVTIDNASSYMTAGYTFKAFMFDSLSTAVPQVESESVTIAAATE